MKIAIVGANIATKMLAPYGDPLWAIWACSQSNESELPRHDAWFELHDPAILGAEYRAWLAGLPLVWMRQVYPEVPGSRPYPVDDMVRRYGRWFFTSTIPWMLAKAIEETPEAIGIWGVEMTAHEAWHLERPAVHHFAQLALDRGIAVTVPKGCTLLDPLPLYGVA